MTSDWTKKLYRFSMLKHIAEMTGPYTSVVAWLKDINVIPADVTYVKPTQVKNELDPLNIDAGYLASVAYEWDSWGPSHPEDFMDALACELKGSAQRDAVSAILVALGRATEGTDAVAA